MLFGYDWELSKSPAGAHQWHPVGVKDQDLAPEVDGSDKKVPTMMATTDIALIKDPAYLEISKKFHEDHEYFADCYARAWFKLTHRDMGPLNRYLGADVPSEELIWQDPLPAREGEVMDDADIATLKEQILASDLSIGELVNVAWASASSYRDSDKRGGANGARIRLAPMKDWEGNDPATLAKVLGVLEGIQSSFGKPVSIADLIVLGGCAAIEKAAKDAGHDVTVPFNPGRVDAGDEHTDAESFAVLELHENGLYRARGISIGR